MSLNLPQRPAPSTLKRLPPFHHAHVGSLLRSDAVRLAREAWRNGSIDAQALRKVENDEIKKQVEKLRENGVRDISDGEARRDYFHVDFLKQINGVSVHSNTLEQKSGSVPPTIHVSGKLTLPKGGIEVENFNFLKSLVPSDEVKQIKIAIPSPTMCHFRGGRAGISSEAYPDLSDFWADLTRVYREELNLLYQAGCRYVQLDDTNLAYLTDSTSREAAEKRGEDVSSLPDLYAHVINAAIADVPEDMVVGIHLCKGNFKSQFFALGSPEGYKPIAKSLFQSLNVDFYCLEWEDPSRSGKDFSALEHLPPTKTVVLGLVSSKVGKLEEAESLKERIREAAKVVPAGLEQLAISPQCGFASTRHANNITEEEQYAKLRLCRQVAQDVWGEA